MQRRRLFKYSYAVYILLIFSHDLFIFCNFCVDDSYDWRILSRIAVEMASSFRQWESDPLFSAAEVVQDSADRMESLFRLLLHEQNLVQEDRTDQKLLKSGEYHWRDLATTLETAKWQLEDFEREVILSATMDKSHTRENVISRHKQFIRAIREQILNVEKSLGDTSVGDLLKSTQGLNLDEQDRNGLQLFISGENPTELVPSHDLEDSNIMRRFLDPTAKSSLNGEIVEHNTGEIEISKMNGVVHLDHDFEFEDNKLKKVGSYYSEKLAFEAPSSVLETASDRHGEDASWDLEANQATDKSFFHKNKLRGYYRRINVFGSLGNLWPPYRGRDRRSFTKRLKDGEEQRHSHSYDNASYGAQGNLQQTSLASGYSYFQGLFSELLARVMQYSWVGNCRARYRRSTYFLLVSRHSKQLISAILVALIMLGILAFLVA